MHRTTRINSGGRFPRALARASLALCLENANETSTPSEPSNQSLPEPRGATAGNPQRPPGMNEMRIWDYAGCMLSHMCRHVGRTYGHYGQVGRQAGKLASVYGTI